MILGIDIGGANTKITEIDDNGDFKVHHMYFPMWRNSNKLAEVLKTYGKGGEDIALVMTAELADAYETKKQGVDEILKAVEDAFDGDIYVFDVDGNFLTTEESRENYLKVSASNWRATAEFVSKNISNNCILVDMGSTTTDIIPIKDGRALATKTDLDRLMNNELVYVGTLRTPLSFLSNKVSFREKETNVSSEYFAITADISVVLDKIKPEQYTCDTPDGKSTDKKSCMIRLSRVLCGDLEMMDEEEVLTIADQFYNKLTNLIKQNVDKVAEKYDLTNATVVVTGLGEEILKDALKDYTIVSIKEKYGEDVSLATPSFAVGMLLKSELNSGK